MNHAVTRHRAAMHRLTYMVGKAHGPLNRYIQRCCGSWGWRAKRHIDPADGNCTPSGFKEYDKRTNGFALTIFAVISGWALVDSRACNWTSCTTQP